MKTSYVQLINNSLNITDKVIDYETANILEIFYKLYYMKLKKKSFDLEGELENLIFYFQDDETHTIMKVIDEIYNDYWEMTSNYLLTCFKSIFDVMYSQDELSNDEFKGYDDYVLVNNNDRFNIKSFFPIDPRAEYEQLTDLIKIVSLETRRERLIKKCENELKSYLHFKGGLVTRKELEENVGHYHMLYKIFLKPPYLLDYKGSYYPLDKIYLSDNDKNLITKYIGRILNKEKIIHINGIYDELKEIVPVFIKNNELFTSYALFSVLEYFLVDTFNFSRPYIFDRKIRAKNEHGIVLEYLSSRDRVGLSEFQNYLKKLELFSEEGLITVIEKMEEVVIFENKNLLVKQELINNIGIVIQHLESILVNELLEKNRMMAIVEMDSLYDFEVEGLDWDEWFIYSILSKYSKKINVALTSRTFDYAIPVIWIGDTYSERELQYISSYTKEMKIHKRRKYSSLDEIEIDINDLDDFFE